MKRKKLEENVLHKKLFSFFVFRFPHAQNNHLKPSSATLFYVLRIIPHAFSPLGKQKNHLTLIPDSREIKERE